MPTDDERLAILIEGRVSDFEKSMATVTKRVAKMEKSIQGEMKGVERSSKRAADSMEREFAQATTGIAGKVRALRTMTGDFRSTFGGLAGAAAAIGPGTGVVGAVGGFAGGALVSKVNTVTGAIADMRAEAERAGLSFREFQEVKFAFAQERISLDAMVDGFKELQLRVDEFVVTGKGPAAEAFERLGYTADELATKVKKPVDLLLEIVDRARALGDTAAAIRILDEALGGTGGEQFVQLLDAGGDKLRDNIARSHELGTILSDEVGDRAVEVNNAFTEMSAIIETRVNTALTNTSHWVLEIGRAIGTWQTALERFLSRLGNSSELGRFNQWMIRNGLADTSGLTFLDEGLNTAAVEAQALEVERLQIMLDDANAAIRSLEGEDAGATRIDAARRKAAEFADQLSRAESALARLRRGPLDLTVNGGTPAAAPTAAPAAAPATTGTMGAHGQRLVSIKSASGLTATVNAEHAAKFQGLIDDLEAQGYAIRSLGGYNNRNIAGTNKLSNHAFGNAIDINPTENPMGPNLITDMPANVAELAKKHGLSWGGNWRSKKDAMHFEAPGGASTDSVYSQMASDAARQSEAARTEQIAARDRQAEAIRRVNEQLAQEIELEAQRAEMLANGFTVEQVNAALDKEALLRDQINQLKSAGVQVDAQMEESLRRQVDTLWQHREAAEAAAAAQDGLAQAQQDAASTAQAIGQPILDTLMSIGDGAEDATEKFKRLAQQMAQMVLQAALFGGGPLGQFFGGGLLGGLGKRASGGPVTAGRPYLVGENGREFFVPGTSGHILNAARTQALMSRMATPAMLAAPAAPSGGRAGMHMTLGWSRSADGNLKPFVESVSRATAGPVAEAAAARHADNVRSEVPSMVDARNHQRETRRTGTIRSRRGLA